MFNADTCVLMMVPLRWRDHHAGFPTVIAFKRYVFPANSCTFSVERVMKSKLLMLNSLLSHIFDIGGTPSDLPPSTVIQVPVTMAEASLAKYSTACATSCGVIMR